MTSPEVTQNYSQDLENTQIMCSLLMQTPHYAKLGPDGVFAIIETAKSLGIDVRLALGGGLYYVKGKVEMSARLMNSMIRSNKHSIMRDEKSDDKICILHGRRADNGDVWTESFSMAEASKAGLTKSTPWQNFARDMLFARALSRLARQLFPDVIGNCYVEGEISYDVNIKENTDTIEPIPKEPVTQEQIGTIEGYLDLMPELREKLTFKIEEKDFSYAVKMIATLQKKWAEKIKEIETAKDGE